MTSDRLLDRVLAANPAPSATTTDDELFARIVAGPGDPRLGAAPGRRRRRLGTRGLALVAAVAVLGAGGAAFGAAKLVLYTPARRPCSRPTHRASSPGARVDPGWGPASQ
jgi:hypothetical protein